MQIRKIACGVMAATLTFAPVATYAAPFTYNLEFNTANQSIWDTGSAAQLNETVFLGAQWDNLETGIDLLAGGPTDVINPARIAYDAAFASCRGLGFSSSVCINGQSARAFVPRLGSRPRVRSCGTFDFSCQAKRLVDISRRAAYDAAFAACRGLGFSSSVCRNGQSARLPVPALGTAPPEFLTIDTSTGAEISASTDGRVGVEIGIEIDSGSVDATVSYAATLDIPDTMGLDKSNPINFNPNSELSGVNTLETNFSEIVLTADAVMEISGSVSAQACAVGACVSDGAPIDIDERAPIFSFNEDGNGAIEILGLPGSVFDPNLGGFPISVDVAGLVEATLHFPNPDASGGLDPMTNTLKATGQDDFFDLLADLDNIVATAAGVPGLFGSSFDVGTLGSVGFDIINVQLGPTIDLQQDFELDPTLFVMLDFDQAVMIAGELVTKWMGQWDFLPDITFIEDITTVIPTFFLDANLMNETLLDFDFQFLVDLLQINFEFPVLNIDETIGIGNILDKAIDLFDSPNLYENLFPLIGFNLQIGDPFVVDFTSGSTAPQTAAARSADNPLTLFDPEDVPQPAALILLLFGLGGLLFTQRRRMRNRI